jgi:hypothetical protein
MWGGVVEVEMNNKSLPALHERGHVFVAGAHLGFGKDSLLYTAFVCAQCGIIRSPNGAKSDCRGKTKVELRDAEAA